MVSVRGVARQQQEDCCSFGVEWRAAIYTCDLTSLLAGLSDGVGEMLLMASGDVEPNPGPQTLFDAIKRGKLSEVERLLSSGEADVNEQDRFGCTVLILASKQGRLQLVQMLIAKGANVNSKDEYGQTPLMSASEFGFDSVVRELVNSGAKVNDRAMRGGTAVMRASYWGRLSVIKYLVEKGADVNCCDQQGKTALDLAMRNGQDAVVEYLSEIRLATFIGELQNRDDPLSRVLTETDLPALIRVLSNTAYKARTLGIQLELVSDLISTLENKASHDPVKVLTSVLETRLKRTPPLTLNHLIGLLSGVPFSDEALALDLQKYFTPVTTKDPQLPGVRFLGTPMSEAVASEGKEIFWDDSIGVAFSIPPGAVPEGKKLQLTIRPCLAGPFEPPDQYQLTSPSYHVSLSGELTKEFEMVLYHSVKLRSDDDCKRMSFLSAPGTPTHDESHYKFSVLEGGVFRQNDSFGTINLRHVCVIALGIMGPKPADMYSARLYRNSSTPGGPCTRAAFCMVPCQPLYTTHLSKYLERMQPEFVKTTPTICEPVQFSVGSTQPKVTLERPSGTAGYTITSDQDQLQISKEKVNSVLTNSSELPEDYPARLFLDIRPVGDAPPPGSCKLTILGLEEELSFELKPQSTSADVSASSHASKPLKVSDLSEVYRKIYPQRAHWHPIGINLDLPPDILENIERQFALNEQRLEKVLLEWLRRRQSLRPSWQALINALEDVTVGEEAAANNLKKYLMSKAAEEGSAVKEGVSEGTPQTVVGTQRTLKVDGLEGGDQATAGTTQTSAGLSTATPTAPPSTAGAKESEGSPQSQSVLTQRKVPGPEATAWPALTSTALPTATPTATPSTGYLRSKVWIVLVLVGLLVALPLAVLLVYLK